MKLDKFGLTKDAILDGEYAEFDAVENPKKVKENMYLASVVDTIVQDAFSDLEDAYKENDALTEELESVQAQLESAQMDVQRANAAAEVKAVDDAKVKQAENLLADLELSFRNIKEKSEADTQTIENLKAELSNAVAQVNSSTNDEEVDILRTQIQELESRVAQRDDDYATLAADVNAVLDGLEAKFNELE